MRVLVLGPTVVVAGVVAGCSPETRPPNRQEQSQFTNDDKSDAAATRPLKADRLQPKDLKIQVPLGDGAAGDWGSISFKITKVYEKQDFIKAPPFHINGGKWTFFDCRIAKAKQVPFTVGVSSKGDDKGSFAWGKAVLVVSDRHAGRLFMNLFAKSFHATAPLARLPETPLEPLLMGTAILGENLKRNPGGGFDGTGEGWMATKWFPQQNGLEAEVFFNYNVQRQEGEFVEKDPDYRQDLLAIFATALRDGPRPDRTPNTDPNLASAGPRIEEIRCMLPGRPSYCSFSPDGNSVVYADKSVIYAVNTSQPDKPKELARLEKSLWSVYVHDNRLRLLVCESLPASETSMSSDDPQRLWWVEPAGNGRQLLLGPEKDITLGDAPVSPDARYIAIEHWKELAGQRGRYTTVTFLDRQRRSTKVAELSNESLSAAGWQGGGSELRAVLIANRWSNDKGSPKTVYLADPATGTFVLGKDVPVPNSENHLVSPDGKHRAEIEGKERLVVVDVATNEKRFFNFHEDDVPFVGEGCVEWVGSGYLKFNAARLSLIDIRSMKMSYPTPRLASGTSASYTFSPDCRWVLCQKQEGENPGLFLGRVIIDADGTQRK